MIFWLLLITLLIGGAWGEWHFARPGKPPDRKTYSGFLYGCYVLFAALPIATGDWPWSLVVLPFALITARIVIARRFR